MKCNYPNYIYFSDSDTENKKRVHFVNGKTAADYFERLPVDRSMLIEVPCGQCVACRLDYSRTWANRCYLESLCHPYNWFITLTYDDDHVVLGDKGNATLEKDAISSFMRKLRDLLGHDKNIRYFGCGEYGDLTLRPHYHIIVFGPELDDLSIDIPDRTKESINGKYPFYRRKNSNGDYVMYSDKVFQCWQKGKIEVEECSWNTAAYVSRYVMKKQKGMNKTIYEKLGILPEYLRMSTRPGIGADWFDYNKNKLLESDYLSVKNKAGIQTSRPPRYFEKMMMKDEDSLEAALFSSNKINRINNARKRFVIESSKKSVKQKGEDSEEILKSKTKVLQRNLT